MAYYSAISNPFLKLIDGTTDPSPYLALNSQQWKGFNKKVDEITRVVGGAQTS